MSWFDAWTYGPLARANGMRLPPTTTAERGPEVSPAMLPPTSKVELRSDADVLDLEVLLDALETTFTAEARVLDPAERRRRVGHDALVDADHPELQGLADPQRARQVAGEYVSHQAVFRVVGPRDRLRLGGERRDRRHRAEDLFAHHQGVRGHAGQERGCVEVALVPDCVPAADNCGALGLGVIDQVSHPRLGGGVDQRAEGDALLGT